MRSVILPMNEAPFPRRKVLCFSFHWRDPWREGQMRRREFIGILGGGLGFSPNIARAQQSANKKRIAIISPARPVEEMKTHPCFRAFLDELSRRGFVDGQNLIVD